MDVRDAGPGQADRHGELSSAELSGSGGLRNLALARGEVDRATARRTDAAWLAAAWLGGGCADCSRASCPGLTSARAACVIGGGAVCACPIGWPCGDPVPGTCWAPGASGRLSPPAAPRVAVTTPAWASAFKSLATVAKGNRVAAATEVAFSCRSGARARWVATMTP